MSAGYGFANRIAARRPQDTQYRQVPRKQTHSHIFFYVMSVNFNSVVNETTPAFSKDVGFDSLILGAWTDLIAAKTRLSQTSSDWAFSSVQIEVRNLFGGPNLVKPYLWWGTPIFLPAHTSMKADWTNVGGEPAGTAVFYAKKVAMYDRAGNETAPGDKQIIVTQSTPYRIRLDLGTTTPTTDIINSDLLVRGATCNLETSTILGKIFNESTNYSWSSQQIPIRAMAGVDGQVEPILWFDQPYLLPANVRLRGEISAAVTGGYMDFICERILA